MDKKTALTLVFGIVIGIVIGYLGAMAFDSPATAVATAQVAQHQDPKAEYAQFINAKKEELSKNPDNIKTRTDLANMLFDTGDYKTASEHYIMVLEKAPNNANILSDLGVCYRRMDDSAKALEYFIKAVEAEPKHPKVWYNKAIVYYYDLGNLDEAKKALAKVLEIDPFYESAIKLNAEIDSKLKGK